MRWTGEALPVAAVRGEIGRAPTGARLLLAGRQLVPTRERPLLMGILNATPDSFSDGGRYQGLEAQVARAHELTEAGADLIDVGGESGVTNRPPVSAEEEIGRVVPLVERLAAGGVTVSIDTWKPSVARAALDAGASLVNDFSGLHHAAIADACADAGAGLVLTHTRAKPKVKPSRPMTTCSPTCARSSPSASPWRSSAESERTRSWSTPALTCRRPRRSR